MRVAVIQVGMLATNCALVWCPQSKEGLVVDPGAEGKKIIERVRSLDLRIRWVINTHAHIDHTGANAVLAEKLGAAVALHEKDLDLYTNPGFGIKLLARKLPRPTRLLLEGDKVAIGNRQLQVIETPGHTPGSISLQGENVLFCGDTVFASSIGRTDLPGGSHRQLMESIRDKLMVLPPGTTLYPGHGPNSTIGAEAEKNPYIE